MNQHKGIVRGMDPAGARILLRLSALLAGSMVCVAAFFGGGCGKSRSAQSQASQFQGIDLPKFNQAFANANPDVGRMVSGAAYQIRCRKYDKALEELDKLTSEPSLTDAQKQVVNDVIQQVKQAQQKASQS